MEANEEIDFDRTEPQVRALIQVSRLGVQLIFSYETSTINGKAGTPESANLNSTHSL